MATPRRRRWIWLIAIASLLLGSWIAVRALLQPERLSAFLLQQARAATGLDLTLSAPVDVGFWPDLHLELDGLTARLPGSDDIVLQAEAVEVVLPWSALSAETIQLRSLRLQRPVLDTAALSHWLAMRSDDGPPAPFRLPRIDAAVAVEAGRIVGEDWAIDALDLSLPFLRPDVATRVDASGTIELTAREPQRFSASFDLSSGNDGSELRFDPMRIDLLAAADMPPQMRIEGRAALQPPESLHFDLTTTMREWPSDWPALPLPGGDGDSEVRFEIQYRGTTELQGEIVARLARGDADLRGRLTLGDVFAWLEDPATNLLPPLRGEITSDRMDAAGFELRGVRIRVEDSPPAAGAADAD